ncbi:helix-turn-helix domain-containing protein [Entomohabitans teleogrylli]|uniref:helix-turn-helix domain-containing protein n=1 Tax=Entomohabitans teleogrylli TaxID=1384589 RepID=UPI00073D9266|nr:helix-turn-helix domain-containing protein [Entomohabitans teleogrylli]
MTLTQHELVAQSGFSTRYFQQVFRQHFGVTPRHFRRIIRLEQLTRHLLLTRQRDYLDSALAYGYYDQSHFIHDFRHFTGATPSHFLQETNFSAHFYNYPSQG